MKIWGCTGSHHDSQFELSLQRIGVDMLGTGAPPSIRRQQKDDGETKRSIHDALCVARNLIINNSIVYGGGSAEISCSIVVEAAADRHPEVEQSTQSGCFLMLWMLFPLALPENSDGAGRSSPLHRLLFGGVKQNAEDAPLCLRAQRPRGRRGWQVLALHRGSDGRAWCGSAGQRQEGRAWAARDARPLALLPQAQGGDEMVGMVLLLRRHCKGEYDTRIN
uniref:Uncharacterized protein n=1 Tax=Aegilops tauschii subsp. strangulata TaxID=200361 RepID=A0A453NC86_AEGTS